MTTFVGFLAAALTTISFLPQAIKVLRSRDTSGLSLVMYVLFSIGVALWTVYGVLTWSGPVIAANAITLVLSLTILRAIWRNRGAPPAADHSAGTDRGRGRGRGTSVSE